MEIRPAELHQVDADEADIDHATRHTRQRDPVSHPHPIAADEEKIRHDSQNHVLQGHGNTRGHEADVGRNGADFRHQSEHNHERQGDPDGHPPQHEELTPATQIVEIPERRPPPDLGNDQDYGNPPEHDANTQHKITRDRVHARSNGRPPIIERAGRALDREGLLSQRHEYRR